MGATTTWDDEQKVPYLTLGNQWIGYDDERSLKIKVYLHTVTFP